MQQRQKCCLHCPGTWKSSSQDRREEHLCRLPTYVQGNLKLSSLQKCVRHESERDERLRGVPAVIKNHEDRLSSCYDRFAIAKKFHAENLEHQPLPDRVDDSVFRNVRPINGGVNPRLMPQKRSTSGNQRGLSQKLHGGLQYTPILGCKTPTTNMDLAICWEAPVDPSYEPNRAIHIDGTDGGPAPAIFALVEHEIPHHETHRNPEKCLRSVVETYEAKFSNVKNRCLCTGEQKARAEPSRIVCTSNDKEVAGVISGDLCCESSESNEKLEPQQKLRSSDGDLCEELDSIHISEIPRSITGCKNSLEPGRRKLQPLHLRNCSSCECRGERTARKQREPRLVHSAYTGARNLRRNGLPTKLTVPRPRTPYAKRSFCIDTLTPPFSIISGCRDADYPEHWRLTSVYQQSYKNPRKQRGTIFNYD